MHLAPPSVLHEFGRWTNTCGKKGGRQKGIYGIHMEYRWHRDPPALLYSHKLFQMTAGRGRKGALVAFHVPVSESSTLQ
jgi:hypothetical protein